jgi:hypothetical protein
VVPAGVTAIGIGAFGGAASLTRLTIPQGVTSIGIGAFSHATALTELTIPSTVTAISGWTFDSATGLTTVTLPATITSIGTNAFIGTAGLLGIQFLGNAPATVSGGAFNGVTASARRFPTATGFGAGPTWRGLALDYWMPAPDAPTAVAGLLSATVTVTTPSVGPTPTAFTMSAVEDPSKQCTVAGASGSCTITDLTAGTAYTFVATDTDGNATSAASAASTPVTPSGPPAPAPSPAVPATDGSGGSPAPAPSPDVSPAPLRQTPPRQVGGAIVSTGLVPDGATSVVQVASGGAGGTAAHAMAAARVARQCTITTRGSTRTYRCSMRLGAGRWTLTTQARAGTTVIAQSVRRVVVAPVRRNAVTG